MVLKDSIEFRKIFAADILVVKLMDKDYGDNHASPDLFLVLWNFSSPRYEIMQSCWLPPSQRPSVAEVSLLLSSLLAAERGMVRGSIGEEDEEDEEYKEGRARRGESEESFERRWDSLRPPAFQITASERQREREYGREDRDNCYPLLDPVGNCISSSSSELDDILTVTETSKGLNFEYFWEKAHGRRGYKPLPPPQPIPTVNHTHRQSLDTPTVVPVISARSPSLASEYYIRLEEHTPQDKSQTLKGKAQSSFRSDSMCPGDVELVEIRSGMLGKERIPYSSSSEEYRGAGGKSIQTVRSSEVQLQVPNTGVVEFRDTSSRVTDFSVVDLGDDEEEEEKKKKNSETDRGSSTSSQAPVLPPKPRSMSMSLANHLHSRPLPAPPLGYHRGLPHYTMGGKVETDSHHMSSCPPSTFDHLGFHRPRQTLPPSPSLSPSLPPSSHPIYPPPQMCPPPLPPHCKSQRGYPIYSTADTYSRYSKPQTHSQKDPLSCDYTDKDGGVRRAESLHNSKESSHSRTKGFDSPVRRQNPLRPVYRNLPRSQSTMPQIERHSSSSPTYSDEDDSPFMSPEKPVSGTTVTHSSLSEDADPATAELFSRGMKRTQSRLATILPAIWREDAELQAERVAAAKKSPMHLFLTEISSVTESSSESKSEVGRASWEGDKKEKRDEEKSSSFPLPNRGMRRSRSLVTELGSAGQSGGAERHSTSTAAEEENTVTRGSLQRDLFLTEIDTARMEPDEGEPDERDSVKYLHPPGPRPRPYVCAPGLPSYTKAEEAYSKGIQRSRSLLSEITIGRSESEPQEAEKVPQRTEMTREEFLKEIHSAETFLTEIISRQSAGAATNEEEEESSHSPTLMSPEYESICIDPNSSQTIRFQTESSIRASNRGKDDTQTEAIYAQVTKRAKKSEIKVTVRPEIPILHIGSGKLPGKREGEADNDSQTVEGTADTKPHSDPQCQSGEFVFSEIMPKNGLLLNQTPSQREEEDCSEGPALPARGGTQRDTNSAEEFMNVPHEDESHITDETASRGERIIENYESMKDDEQTSGTGAEDQTQGKTDGNSHNYKTEESRTDQGPAMESKNHMGVDSESSKSYDTQNNVESSVETKLVNSQQHSDNSQAKQCHTSKKTATPAATPTTPDWDQSSDISLVTPTDSVLSPMTSSSADCLTPSDSWMGGGGGGGGFRALGNETPHRDSAYFSDSDWEGEGLNRRGSDGLSASRPSNGRGGERGTLTGIEEKTEVEEEGEKGGNRPLKESVMVSDNKAETDERETIETSEGRRDPYQNTPENDIAHIGNDKDISSKGLDSAQREDSGIFHNESRETEGSGLVKPRLLSDESLAKGSVEFIAKLFSNLEDEPLKGFPYSDDAQMDNHYTDGVISHVQITDCKYPDSTEKDLKLLSKNIAEADSLIEPVSGSQSNDCAAGLNNKEYLGIIQTDNDVSAMKAPHSENDSVDPVTPSHYDNSESRLSRFYGIQTSDAKLGDSLPSVPEPNNGECVDDKVSSLTRSFWAEGGVEVPERHEERPGLELQHIDANELGLRNLCYSEDSEDKKAKTETEQQLAAGELSTATKEKSPQREVVREGQRGEGSASNTDRESSEGLEEKTKELWNTLEEEERTEGGVVRGEFDCHRFSQRDLHLWPAENDQWASPENRRQEAELGSEFFPGFSKKAWEVGERLVVGREFWEAEENDELAGSEPHPTVLEGCEEDTCNDETQGQASHLGVKGQRDRDIDIQQAVQLLDVQQEENIENLEEMYDDNRGLKGGILEIEVENVEIPEKETIDKGQNQMTSSNGAVGNSKGQLDFAEDEEENHNFNRWPQNPLCEIPEEQQPSAENVETQKGLDFTHTLENINSNISICTTEAPQLDLSGLEDIEPIMDSETEISPQIAQQEREGIMGIMNVEEEDYRDISLPSDPLSCSNDNGLPMQEEIDQSYPQVDNFSSVDFPSPPPSIDLDVQDDKLESLDDSFPSPPPSVIDREDFISHMTLEDFIASTETQTYISPTPDTDTSEPPLQELPPATTQSRGISANLNLSPVHLTLESESHLTSNSVCENDQKNQFQKTSTAQHSLGSLPELLISEWKDLDEEPLEDFEKLEQLCCISGDEEDTLGDLFLGNLELLESLKRTPEQKPRGTGDGKKGEETCGSSTPDGRRVDLKEDIDGISESSDKVAESVPCVVQESQAKQPPKEEGCGVQSPCHTSDVKDQGSLSTMPTKNGLMMQVSIKHLVLNACLYDFL